MLKKIFVFALIFSLPVGAQAEKIKLRTGRVIEGDIIERTDDYVIIEKGKKTWKIRFSMMMFDSETRAKKAEVVVKKKPASQNEGGQPEENGLGEFKMNGMQPDYVYLEKIGIGGDATPFMKIYKEALDEYLVDRENAMLLAIKTQLIANYDVSRVADTSAHQAWTILKEFHQPIILWGNYHPKEYQEALKKTIQWARSIPAPTYVPEWMLNHGRQAMTARAEGKELPNPYVENYDPQKIWDQEVSRLQGFLNQKELWEALEKSVEPDNAYDTLMQSARQMLEYINQKAGLPPEKIEEMRKKLERLVSQYYGLEGEVGDKMLQIRTEIDNYVYDFLDKNMEKE